MAMKGNKFVLFRVDSFPEKAFYQFVVYACNLALNVAQTLSMCRMFRIAHTAEVDVYLSKLNFAISS